MRANGFNGPERVIAIKRQPGGGLGISVKGGAEHGIPVLISRVFDGKAADQTNLHPGDAILAINGKKVDHLMHDQVVSELRTCGPDVSLTVCAFDGANHVLLNKNMQIPQALPKVEIDESGTYHSDMPTYTATDAQAPDSLQKTYNAQQNTSTLLDSSGYQQPTNDQYIYLPFARLERYQAGTDIARADSFEVIGENQSSSELIVCSSEDEMTKWFTKISEAIRLASDRYMEKLSGELSCKEIVKMGWVGERALGNPSWTIFFLILTKEELRFFSLPPKTREDWEKCKRKHFIDEILFRLHSKSRPLYDERMHCFSLQHAPRDPIYCSVQTRADLLDWEDKVQRAKHECVHSVKERTYSCMIKNRECKLRIHITDGFEMVDAVTQNVIFAYKFSQLKFSSDDGDTRITLTFHNRIINQNDYQTFNCQRAYSLLFCIHSYLSAKLALIKPAVIAKLDNETSSNQAENVAGDDGKI